LSGSGSPGTGNPGKLAAWVLVSGLAIWGTAAALRSAGASVLIQSLGGGVAGIMTFGPAYLSFKEGRRSKLVALASLAAGAGAITFAALLALSGVALYLLPLSISLTGYITALAVGRRAGAR